MDGNALGEVGMGTIDQQVMHPNGVVAGIDFSDGLRNQTIALQNEPVISYFQITRRAKVSGSIEKRMLGGHADRSTGRLDDQVA